DFGIIVDGAVILVEHLFYRLGHEGQDEERPIQDRVLEAAREVARPTLFSLLIIIAAYLPIFALQRVEGRIFSPMANTVVSALIGTLLMSLTSVPVLSVYALRKPSHRRESPALTWARRLYAPAISFAMNNRAIVMTLSAGALAAALTLVPRLGSEFLPELN